MAHGAVARQVRGRRQVKVGSRESRQVVHPRLVGAKCVSTTASSANVLADSCAKRRDPRWPVPSESAPSSGRNTEITNERQASAVWEGTACTMDIWKEGLILCSL